MKALIIGATGSTGSKVLELLLKDETYSQVTVFVRRELKIKHDKLKVHIIDFNQTEQWKTLVQGDALFSCLGTTLQAAGSKDAQWKIDYDYQYQFAKAAQQNGVTNYVLISSSNASSKSFFFYSKMKGQLEDAVKLLGFSKLLIFRPPLLIREKSERKMEVLATKVLTFFNNVGLLRSQKPMPTNVLAKAMVKAVKVLDNGQHIIEGQHILNVT